MQGAEREFNVSPEIAPPVLSLPSDLRFLPVARAFVEAACRAAGLNSELTDAMVLATDEAVNNAMRHAHQNDIALTVQIACFLGTDCVEVQVHDEGEPFDVTAVPHIDPGEVRVGGRGVFLMRTLMDEIHCQARRPRGNSVRLIKRRPRT
jgi:serine/threonine-protein kinase RsbW